MFAARLSEALERATLRAMAQSDRTKWDARYSDNPAVGEAPAWLEAFDAQIPRQGRALDIGAGTGRIARWAAARGLDTIALDISAVGLQTIEHPRINTVQRDLDLDPRLPDGPFQLITVFWYRQPSLAAAIHAALATGGVLLAELPTLSNLERNSHPSQRWLAHPGELRQLAHSLQIVSYEESWLEGRHTARLVARREAGLLDERPKTAQAGP